MRLGAKNQGPDDRVQISRIDVVVHDHEKFSQSRREGGGAVKRLPGLARVRDFHLDDEESPPAALFMNGHLLDAAQAHAFF